MIKFLAASALIFVILVGWLFVQHLYRRFASANPLLGPFRDPEGGCGGGCSCQSGSCSTDRP